MEKVAPVLLEKAVRRLVAALQPESIYLYGSHAYGQPHRDSDVDLLSFQMQLTASSENWPTIGALSLAKTGVKE